VILPTGCDDFGHNGTIFAVKAGLCGLLTLAVNIPYSHGVRGGERNNRDTDLLIPIVPGRGKPVIRKWCDVEMYACIYPSITPLPP